MEKRGIPLQEAIRSFERSYNYYERPEHLKDELPTYYVFTEMGRVYQTFNLIEL